MRFLLNPKRYRGHARRIEPEEVEGNTLGDVLAEDVLESIGLDDTYTKRQWDRVEGPWTNEAQQMHEWRGRQEGLYAPSGGIQEWNPEWTQWYIDFLSGKLSGDAYNKRMLDAGITQGTMLDAIAQGSGRILDKGLVVERTPGLHSGAKTHKPGYVYSAYVSRPENIATAYKYGIPETAQVYHLPKDTLVWNSKGHADTDEVLLSGDTLRALDEVGQGKSPLEYFGIGLPGKWKVPYLTGEKSKVRSLSGIAGLEGGWEALKEWYRNVKQPDSEYTERRASSMARRAQGDGAPELEKIAKTAGAIGSALAGETAGGLAGIAGATLPGEQGQGVKWLNTTRDALTWTPDDISGLESVARATEPLAKIDEVFENLGGKAVDKTGSPLIGTAVRTLPEIIAALTVGGRALRRGD